MKKYPLLLGLALAFSACLRLDNNLYNPNVTPITEYRFDAYPNFEEPVLGPQYSIADSMVHLFTLNSVDKEGKTVQIYAVYVGDLARIATDTVFLYCHGNKNHMDHYWQRTKMLANVGHKHRFGVLTFDYQGYGLSQGQPYEEGLYRDADAALTWLKDRGLTGDRLFMYGFSMGSAPATELTANARSLQPSRLFLEAPFASAEVMVQDAAVLALPGSYFTDLKIDNAEEIKKVTQPFFWIHGELDDFLSIRTHGSVVARNYGGLRKTEVRVPGAGHSNIPTVMGVENYLQAILTFIEQR